MECSGSDLASVRAFLRASCDDDVLLDRLEVSYVQGGPDGPVRVLYEGPGRNGDVLRLTARRVKAAKGLELETAIRARGTRPVVSTGFAQTAFYAPALDLLFQVFPTDDRLPSLPVAVDGAAMAPVLESVLAPHAAGSRLQSVTPRVMRYKPERKCLLRYDLAWCDGAPDTAPRVVWARVARRAKFERTRNILPRVHPLAAGLGFELPEPLGVVPHLAMELFGPVPGVALFALVQRADFPALCRRVGESLRRFHGLRVEVEEVLDLPAQIARLEENAIEFGGMMPAERERIEAVKRELTARLRALAPSPLRLIHRDFHGDNVLVADGRLVLLDFEDCAMGEPADDVGSNWAQLTWHEHRAGEQRALPEAAKRAFLEGYLEAADPTTAACLPTYAAMHCFLYAHQCLRHPLEPARFNDARPMLAACEDVLEQGLP
jgi:hypothetical protein